MSSKHLLPMLLAGLAGWMALSPVALAGKKGRLAARAKISVRAPKAPAPSAGAARPGRAADDVRAERSGVVPPAAAAADAVDPAAAAAVPGAAPAASKPHVYTFSGLDVNGDLKAPQLLFFRGRVAQELDTSSPEKRSFLKELERTADAQGL